MTAFIVDCANQPGELARIAEAVAAKGVNIRTGAGLAAADRGAVALLTEDDDGARTALREAGIDFRECETVHKALDDQPGTLAAAARALADAGVNLEFFLPHAFGEQTTIVFGVSDAEAARTVLGG
jgi:hypothetical protein